MSKSKAEQEQELIKSGSKSIETEGVAVQGQDTGPWGVLVNFQFIPNPVTTANLSAEQLLTEVEETLRHSLYNHCEKIGWYPTSSKKRKPYQINKQEDGSYLLTAYLQHHTKPGAMDIGSHQRDKIVGINKK